MRKMKDSGIEWIGNIPSDKYVLRNKYMLFYEKGKIPNSTNNEGRGKPYIGASDLDSTSDYDLYTEDDSIPESKGDELLVLWDGARAGIAGTKKVGKVSSTIVKITGNKSVYQPFLYWYYMGFVGYMMDMVNGTTIPHMNRKYIEDIGFINWTLSEQQNMTYYLDSKCSKIDEIIVKQEQIIEKLKEYKLSVITEAVTKGLDSNVEMKDSGVEWIGKIPSHWRISKIKQVASFFNGDRSSKYPSGDDIVSDGVLFVTSNNLGLMYLNTEIETNKYITKEKYMDLGGAKIRRNDIIYCLRGSVGKCGINKTIDEGTIASALVVIRPLSIDPDYLNIILHTPGVTSVACDNAIGIGSQNLSAKDISEVVIPIPPADEACLIVEKLLDKVIQIEKEVDRWQLFIEKLQCYKKSLIYEVVTGKKEV